jgi:tetratricopeptide (TPR) repeat protein
MRIYLLIVLGVLYGSLGWGQSFENLSPAQRQAAESLRETEAFRRLPAGGSFKERMAAYQDFVDQYPGGQLSLRVMRDISVFYLLQDKAGRADPLKQCADWLGQRLSSPPYAWSRYANASDSMILDRIETQLVYARILANLKGDSGRGRYDEALAALAEGQVEGDNRPNLWNVRPDIKEQIDFARCWCFHGKQSELRTALNYYQRFIQDYPTSDFMPAALLNAARTLNALDPNGGRDQIVLYLTRLRGEYPKSAEAASPDVLKILGE